MLRIDSTSKLAVVPAGEVALVAREVAAFFLGGCQCRRCLLGKWFVGEKYLEGEFFWGGRLKVDDLVVGFNPL